MWCHAQTKHLMSRSNLRIPMWTKASISTTWSVTTPPPPGCFMGSTGRARRWGSGDDSADDTAGVCVSFILRYCTFHRSHLLSGRRSRSRSPVRQAPVQQVPLTPMCLTSTHAFVADCPVIGLGAHLLHHTQPCVDGEPGLWTQTAAPVAG